MAVTNQSPNEKPQGKYTFKGDRMPALIKKTLIEMGKIDFLKNNVIKGWEEYEKGVH